MLSPNCFNKNNKVTEWGQHNVPRSVLTALCIHGRNKFLVGF